MRPKLSVETAKESCGAGTTLNKCRFVSRKEYCKTLCSVGASSSSLLPDHHEVTPRRHARLPLLQARDGIPNVTADAILPIKANAPPRLPSTVASKTPIAGDLPTKQSLKPQEMKQSKTSLPERIPILVVSWLRSWILSSSLSKGGWIPRWNPSVLPLRFLPIPNFPWASFKLGSWLCPEPASWSLIKAKTSGKGIQHKTSWKMTEISSIELSSKLMQFGRQRICRIQELCNFWCRMTSPVKS